MGGGVSQSGNYGANKSSSGSRYNESVFGPQADALGQLYGNAEQLYGAADYNDYNRQGDYASRYGQNVSDQAMPAYGNQLGGGFTDNALQRSIQESMLNPSSMGAMYNSIIGGSGNEYIDPMVSAMRDASMQNYQAQTRPNLDAAAAQAGQSGSSRHGVNQYLAEKNLGSDMLNREMNMRGENWDKDMAMKMSIAQQADLGRGQAQDRAMGMLGMRNAQQTGALNYGQGMQDLGRGGMNTESMIMNAPWDQIARYAETIGAPTVLGSGSSEGSSSGRQFGGTSSASASGGK